ncbi:MAG: CDP-2,3-bis-(O-geranylgeranyl)-sn-glycerol synthase [Candidatus Aenigmarchaeota archaeon]|nr:CDP-2,3-bis-(O-geranylgeranyl)-sn-glycerol synthase [Candidatus Aenigmarchaeota archaeon]
MTLSTDILVGLWLILPAYIANVTAPLAHGRRYVDGGRKFAGKPFLGKGKTWEGTLFAIFMGTAAGMVEISLYPYVNGITSVRGIILPMQTAVSVFALSLGAMLGDMAGAFIKRQSGIPRGEPAPLLDQLDFVIGAFVVASPFIELRPLPVLFVVAFTPLIHLLVNLIGYKLGHKKEPW